MAGLGLRCVVLFFFLVPIPSTVQSTASNHFFRRLGVAGDIFAFFCGPASTLTADLHVPQYPPRAFPGVDFFFVSELEPGPLFEFTLPYAFLFSIFDLLSVAEVWFFGTTRSKLFGSRLRGYHRPTLLPNLGLSFIPCLPSFFSPSWALL